VTIRRTVLALTFVAALSGCGQDPPPTVSLKSASQTATAQATRWCPEGKKCQSHSPPAAVLKVASRGDLTVDVGEVVSKRPWIVLVDGGTASPLQRRSRTFTIVAVRPGVTVEVVTVDSDGTRVFQRDRWVFTVKQE